MENQTHLVAAPVSPWQNKKRTSFRAVVKTYLLDMFAVPPAEGLWMCGLGVIEDVDEIELDGLSFQDRVLRYNAAKKPAFSLEAPFRAAAFASSAVQPIRPLN